MFLAARPAALTPGCPVSPGLHFGWQTDHSCVTHLCTSLHTIHCPVVLMLNRCCCSCHCRRHNHRRTSVPTCASCWKHTPQSSTSRWVDGCVWWLADIWCRVAIMCCCCGAAQVLVCLAATIPAWYVLMLLRSLLLFASVAGQDARKGRQHWGGAQYWLSRCHHADQEGRGMKLGVGGRWYVEGRRFCAGAAVLRECSKTGVLTP